MKDIKELIYAAVEENAVKFQELVNAQLQVRAYDAIEALRPEVGASMFGEAKKMDDEDEGDIFRDRINDFDPEDEDEDEMDNKKKSMKEALHPNQQKIDVVDDEKIDAKDFAKLRQMKKMKEEVDERDPHDRMMDTAYSAALKAGHEPHSMGFTKDRKKVKMISDTGHGHYDIASKKYVHSKVNEEVDEAVNILMKDKDSTALRYPKGHSAQGDAHRAMAAKAAKTARAAGGLKGSDRSTWRRPGGAASGGGVEAARPAKRLGEEAVNEVAMPKNAADWQALITHQIKTTGHPVATDAQFRAQHGKDTSKIASLEPGEDKVHYAAAQGGTVKA